MASVGLWGALESYFKLYRHLTVFPFTVVHDGDLPRVDYRPYSLWGKLFFRFNAANNIFHILYCAYRLVSTVVSKTQTNWTETYLLLYFLSAYFTFLPTSWVIAFKPEIIPNILNPIAALDRGAQRLRRSGGGRGSGAYYNYSVIILAIRSLTCLIAIITLSNFAGSLWLGIDPAGPLFPSTSTSTSTSLLLFSIRAFIFYCTSVDSAKSVSGFIAIGLMVVSSAAAFLTSLLGSIERNPKALTNLQISFYTRIRIWLQFANVNFSYFAVPPLIGFGITICTLTNYGSIRFFGRIHTVFYLCMPITSLLAFLIMNTLLPYAAQVHDNSELLLFRLRRNARSKYARRVVRAMLKVYIPSGSFAQVRGITGLHIYQYVTDYTINLLLTF